MTDKAKDKKHGNMDRFVWAADNITVHPKSKAKDPQSKKSPTAPKGGTK